LRKDDLPDADIVIATFWTTAEFVATLPAAKGRKCYLIQGHETHSGQALDRIHATFRSAMQKIVVSEWLRGVMAQEYGDTSSVLVPNGVDCAQFHAPPRVRNIVPTVGYLHHAAAFKGADIAIEAIAQARRRFPELRSIAFGRGLLTEGPSDPGLSEYFYRPAQSSIRDIYAACDVWLFPSRREGFGLPLLEAAACGTPLVAAPAGAAPEVLAEGIGILVEPDDPAAMAEGILRILDMSGAEWQALSARCVEVARQRTWAASEVRFESVLKGLLQ
jgi:glycosyltransferase involved in cell wall biosynthesis